MLSTCSKLIGFCCSRLLGDRCVSRLSPKEIPKDFYFEQGVVQCPATAASYSFFLRERGVPERCLFLALFLILGIMELISKIYSLSIWLTLELAQTGLDLLNCVFLSHPSHLDCFSVPLSMPEICGILFRIKAFVFVANLSANSSYVANNTIHGEHKEVVAGTCRDCKVFGTRFHAGLQMKQLSSLLILSDS